MRGPSFLLSVIIPVHQGMRTLPLCLANLKQSTYSDYECIVVDDGSTDGSAVFAEQWGARVIHTQGRFGPANARNQGAKAACGNILVFLDADVAVEASALARFAARFTETPACDAVIGSYDDSPADPGLISSFKNLMHHYTHQRGRSTAFSFWCGCGAVRSEVFFSHGGFDDSYAGPSIEDIEFGLRMFQAGRHIMLDPRIQAKHLKIWTLRNLLKTDVLFRGIPWTELILRSRYLPDDLNLRWTQRVSVVAAALLAILVCGMGVIPRGSWPELAAACAGLLAAIAALNIGFHVFLASRRGWLFSISAFPLHLLYFLYSGAAGIAGVASYLIKGLTPGRRTRPRDDSRLERYI